MTVKMADVKVGMRLVSTLERTPAMRYVTVTEITEKGFKYSLDADVPGAPHWSMTTLAEGHEHFGYDGNAFFEPVEEISIRHGRSGKGARKSLCPVSPKVARG